MIQDVYVDETNDDVSITHLDDEAYEYHDQNN